MVDGLVVIVFRIGLALLDRKADALIGRLPEPVRQDVDAAKDLVAFLAGPFGERIAREIAAPALKKALAKRFPNDPTAWSWA
jgi:hypothetical protein